MMRPLICGLLALVCVSRAAATVRDDQAAVAAILPGRIINTSWGWIVGSARGSTHVIRTHSGYTVTTSRETFHLVRTSDGFALSPGRRGVRTLSPDQALDTRERHRNAR